MLQSMNINELLKKVSGKKSDWRQAKGGGWLHKSAIVDDETKITEQAIVWGMVYGNAQVCGDAWVCGDARVFGDEWNTSPLFIVGSKFSLTNAKRGYIQIGCKCETFSFWKTKGLDVVAQDEGFSEKEIKEYRAYINLFIAIGK